MDHYPVNTKFLKSTNSAILNGVFTWLTKISECDLLFYKKKNNSDCKTNCRPTDFILPLFKR